MKTDGWKNFLTRKVVAFLTVLFSVTSAAAQSTPDLILFNGRIFTSDSAMPAAEAIAITGDRIELVGTSENVRKIAGSRTRLIDLGGRTVVPGFNDSHAHFGPTFQGIDLNFPPTASWPEASSALKSAVATAPAGKWITANIGVPVLNDLTVNRGVLDQIAPANPVFLSAFWGHGALFNTAAMKVLGISETEPNPAGGHFDRDARSMRLNGRVFEYAQWRFDRVLAEEGSDDQLIAELKKRAAGVTALGITSMQIMPGISPSRFVRLLEKADLPIRVRVMAASYTTKSGRDLSEVKEMSSLRSSNPNITVSGIKWILDGTPLERGAAMTSSYLDSPNSKGSLNFSEAEIEKMIREALRYEQPLLVHAVGDRTVEIFLNAMEKVGAGKIDWPTKRFRIEHGEGVAGDLIERARKLGVIVVQNPSHFTFADHLHARWGKDSKFSSQRSLIEGGVRYAIGSDGPPNPFLNLMFAITHPARPSEAITREQAVTAYTIGSAFAEFAETKKGTITKGKYADVAVLSQDIFTVPGEALPGTNSVMTIVGGKIVHDAGTLK